MKVLFDYAVFVRAPYSGVSRYIARIAAGMAARPGIEPHVAAYLTNNAFIADVPASNRTALQLPHFRNFWRLARPVNDLLTAAHVATHRYDILHQSIYNPRLGRGGAKAMVSVSHDMLHELQPEHFGTSASAAEKKAVFAQSDLIIAISHATKRDMVERFGYDADRIVVVHHGVDPPGPRAALPPPPRPSLLFVGARMGYKNFLGLLEALSLLPPALADIGLTVFGGGPLQPHEQDAIRRFGLSDRIATMGGDDSILAATYAQSLALIYPSTYEGFGMPLLEAMAQDCPVLTSDASVMPEVAGDAALYFDPAEPASIAAAIARLAESPDLRQALIARGRERLTHFTWDKCVTETLAVYDRALSA